MDVDLTGRTAIVTGASAGIGRAIAADLMSLGANVVVTYAKDAARAEEMARTLGARCRAVQADAAEPTSATAAVDAAVDAFGGLDIVVANAGETARSPLGATAPDVYDRVFDANVRGVWSLFAASAPFLGEGGRLIALSSVRTSTNTPGTALYTASKAAVEAMVRVLARELGPSGVTVNAVAPGATDTALLRSVNDQAAIDAMAGDTPLGRVGQPTDISGAVAFLATPAAGWVTGQVIHASGGFG